MNKKIRIEAIIGLVFGLMLTVVLIVKSSDGTEPKAKDIFNTEIEDENVEQVVGHVALDVVERINAEEDVFFYINTDYNEYIKGSANKQFKDLEHIVELETMNSHSEDMVNDMICADILFYSNVVPEVDVPITLENYVTIEMIDESDNTYLMEKTSMNSESMLSNLKNALIGKSKNDVFEVTISGVDESGKSGSNKYTVKVVSVLDNPLNYLTDEWVAEHSPYSDVDTAEEYIIHINAQIDSQDTKSVRNTNVYNIDSALLSAYDVQVTDDMLSVAEAMIYYEYYIEMESNNVFDMYINDYIKLMNFINSDEELESWLLVKKQQKAQLLCVYSYVLEELNLKINDDIISNQQYISYGVPENTMNYNVAYYYVVQEWMKDYLISIQK